MNPQAYLSANYERILAELIEFASIPSVSTDPAYQEDMARAARWVAEHLRRAGPFDVQMIQTVGHPLVYAEWLGAAGTPTVLVYGHYDVQPPDPLEKWTSDPFKPTIRDGRLYARGVSDDKGPMLIPISVAQAFFATQQALPINVKFLIEGEEETGSPNLENFIAEQANRLSADFVLSADGAMWRIDEPSITIASRGLTALELTLQAASKDLHSGRYGGSVANPLHALAELIASLHTPDGRVAVDGFYDQVQELSSAERQAMAALPFDEGRFLAQVGAPATVGEPGYSTLERQWTRPTLEVNGMWGGYQGPGSKTVIPSVAHAKLSCRLVPNQQPDAVVATVVKHLETHVPRGVQLMITPERHGAIPYHLPANHLGLKAVERVLAEVYGQQPLTVRMGGTLPVSAWFKQLLGIETVFFSFSTADEDFHAPNEFFRLHRLQEGLSAWALCWEQLAIREL